MILFSFDYPPNDGGIARLCGEIAQRLSPGGEMTVLTQEQHGSGSAVPDVPEARLPARRPWREVAAWWQLVRRYRHETVITGIWYPEGLVAVLAGCRSLVVLAHGSELLPTRQRWRRALWARLQRLVLTRARLVIANSSYTADLVATCAPRSQVRAIPLAVDHHRFRPGDRAAARARFGLHDPDVRVICSVSRLDGYKGHSTVLRALASLPPGARGRIVYLIAGKGPAAAGLERAAGELGVADRVRFLGFVAEEDLPDLYRASDLFVLCTRESEANREVEGFGLVFLEAQACGTPVVGTRTGGIPDAIPEGEGGWLIDQDDRAAVAGILGNLVGDPAAFAAMGAAGRARVERSGTWDHYMEQFMAALTGAGLER